MVAVRRTYMYLMSAIALIAIVAALIALLQDLVPPGTRPAITTTALQIALIVIALPFYLVHWLWAQRSAGRDETERASLVRRIYVYGMLALGVGLGTGYAILLVSSLLKLGLGVRLPASSFGNAPDWVENAVNALVALVGWSLVAVAHAWLVRSDETRVPETELLAGVRRIYLFAGCALGLTLATGGAVEVLRWLLYQVADSNAVTTGDRILLMEHLAQLVVGLGVWLFFWLWAQRLFQCENAEEQASAFRKLYLYLAILITVLGAVSGATVMFAGLLRSLLSLPSNGDIRDPLSVVIPLIVVWAYHAAALRRDETVAKEAPRQAGIRRLYWYIVAGIGLAAFLIGLGGDASVLLRVLGGDIFGNGLKEALSWFTAALVAGLPVWIWPWRQAQVAAVAPGTAGASERRSTVRKLYLYFYLFVASMTVLASAVYIVFRLVSLALGERNQGSLVSDLGQFTAYTLIGVAVWAYHGVVLRGDGQLAQRERAERLRAYSVSILDADSGAWGRAVAAEMERELPGVPYILVGLSPAARLGMGANAEALPPHWAESRLVVGPWTMLGGATEVAAQLQASPAFKLLVPTEIPQGEWVGLEMQGEALVVETVHSIKRIIEQDEPHARRLSPLLFLVVVLISLCIVVQILVALFSFLTGVMRG